MQTKNLMFDIEIAGYLLNSNINKYTLEYLSEEYLKLDIATYLKNTEPEEKQLTIF